MFFKVKDRVDLQAALEELCAYLLEAGVPGERVFDGKLAACELLANVLKHTNDETGLRCELTDGHIELKILSESFFKLPERITCSDLLAESGRGLYLVNELSEGQIFSENDGIRVRIRIEK